MWKKMCQFFKKQLWRAMMLLRMCDIITGTSFSSSLFAHIPKLPYCMLCFHALLSRQETRLAFPPLVGVDAAGYYEGMVIREFLSSVRFCSHTAGICLAMADPGGRSDDCIKKQIFPSENSGWPDQVFLLSHFPGSPRNMWKFHSSEGKWVWVWMWVSDRGGSWQDFVCVWQNCWYGSCVFIHVPFLCAPLWRCRGQLKMRIFKRRGEEREKVTRLEEIWIFLSLFTESDFSCLLPCFSIWSLACLLLIINYLPI